MAIIDNLGYIQLGPGSAEVLKRAHVRTVARQGRTDRLGTSGLRHWLVLLLVLAVAALGLEHVAGGGHAAASQAHDLASLSQDASGSEPCCDELDGQSHATVCSTATGCSFCMPIATADVFLQTGADPVETEPAGIGSGRIQPPQLRPPKLTANV
jgi:hypothetical protein